MDRASCIYLAQVMMVAIKQHPEHNKSFEWRHTKNTGQPRKVP